MLKSELVRCIQSRNTRVSFQNVKELHDYVDLALYKKLITITTRLRRSGAITPEEDDMLMDCASLYYEAFLKWLDDAEELEIVVRSK